MNAANSGGDVFGTFTDERDGQTYRTVKMPDGKVWMAQNLNYKPESGNSWCYNDDESMGEKYGRLYDWETAMAVAPAGWHLPSREEWDDLCKAMGGERINQRGTECIVWDDGAGDYITLRFDEDDHIMWNNVGKKLKARSGWGSNSNGTDEYGFLAMPVGIRYLNGTFGIVGYRCDWWTAEEYSGGNAYYRGIIHYYNNVFESYRDKGYALSMRCLVD